MDAYGQARRRGQTYTADETCVWSAYDAYVSNDSQALRACLRPEIEARLLPDPGEPGNVAHRPSDVLWNVRRLHAEGWSFVIDGMRTLADGRVLAHGWAGSGDAGASFCAVHELKDGLLFRVRHWFTTPEELARVGYLDESSPPTSG